MYRFISIILILLLLTSCAIGVDLPYDSSERPKPGNGLVYIYSPNSHCMSFASWSIYLDDKFLVRLGHNTYSKVVLPAGRYKFSTSTDKQLLCHDGRASNWPSVNFDLEENSIVFLEYSARNETTFFCASTCISYLHWQDEIIAQKKIKDAKFIEAQIIKLTQP